MPELPEVETARRTVHKILVGKTIAKVIATNDTLVFDEAPARDFKKALEAARVTGTGRKGKYFWLKLDSKPWPIIHFGMSGHLDVHKAQDSFKMPKSAKLVIQTMDGTAVVFRDARRFGRMRLSDDPLKSKAIARLGFDALIDFPKPRILFDLLQKRKAPIKAVLLDQSIFAGIGNWIADEVLYQSKISPHRLANALSALEVGVLTKKILSVITFAVKAGADHQKFPLSWLFHKRWSKGKKKLHLTESGQKIIFETVGGRTSAWVPEIQK
jgi:formamidopyrimidine-DNA glycosylase